MTRTAGARRRRPVDGPFDVASLNDSSRPTSNPVKGGGGFRRALISPRYREETDVCYFTSQSREREFATHCISLPKDGEPLTSVSAECDRPLIIEGRGLHNGSGHGDESERV